MMTMMGQAKELLRFILYAIRLFIHEANELLTASNVVGSTLAYHNMFRSHR